MPLTVQTEWHGHIQDKATGENGFGYDPYFFLPDENMTAAQLDPIQKNRISHRGQALRELITQLKMRSE
jgi:XTP/dITP diphosphohydrolase